MANPCSVENRRLVACFREIFGEHLPIICGELSAPKDGGFLITMEDDEEKAVLTITPHDRFMSITRIPICKKKKSCDRVIRVVEYGSVSLQKLELARDLILGAKK